MRIFSSTGTEALLTKSPTSGWIFSLIPRKLSDMIIHNAHGDKILCPLSGSPDLELLERIAPADLYNMYYSVFGMDLRPLFAEVTEIGLLRSRRSDLMFFYPPVIGDAAFYDALSTHSWYYDGQRSEFAPAAAWIRPTDRVAEIGCGAGDFAAALECAAYVGLDFNPRALAACRARGLDVRDASVEQEARRNPATYDVVCCFQILEHVAAPNAFLAACLQLLRPGGRLIISVPSADSHMRHAANDILNLPPHHATWWTDACLKWLESGFPVRLLHLRHDTLSDGDHRRAYLKTLFTAALCRERLGRDPRAVETSSEFLAIHAEVTALCERFEHGFISTVMEPNGHTVLAVYEKTDAPD